MGSVIRRARAWCNTKGRGRCEFVWNGIMWLAFLGALLLSFATKQEVNQLELRQKCIIAKIDHHPTGPCGPEGRVIRLPTR